MIGVIVVFETESYVKSLVCTVAADNHRSLYFPFLPAPTLTFAVLCTLIVLILFLFFLLLMLF